MWILGSPFGEQPVIWTPTFSWVSASPEDPHTQVFFISTNSWSDNYYQRYWKFKYFQAEYDILSTKSCSGERLQVSKRKLYYLEYLKKKKDEPRNILHYLALSFVPPPIKGWKGRSDFLSLLNFYQQFLFLSLLPPFSLSQLRFLQSSLS